MRHLSLDPDDCALSCSGRPSTAAPVERFRVRYWSAKLPRRLNHGGVFGG